MFLKVKRAAGKQYFAICVSERRDKKVVTKTICSLGDAEKALPVLRKEYPQFIDRFHDVVGTKIETRFVGTKRVREYGLNQYLCDYCVDFSFYDDLVKIFVPLATQKNSHRVFALSYGIRNLFGRDCLSIEIMAVRTYAPVYVEIGTICIFEGREIDACMSREEEPFFQEAFKLVEQNIEEIEDVLLRSKRM